MLNSFCRVCLSDVSKSTYLEHVAQNQPPEVFYKKAVLKKFRNTHMKTPVLKSLFNKVTGLKSYFNTYFEELLRWLLLTIVSNFNDISDLLLLLESNQERESKTKPFS